MHKLYQFLKYGSSDEVEYAVVENHENQLPNDCPNIPPSNILFVLYILLAISRGKEWISKVVKVKLIFRIQ